MWALGIIYHKIIFNKLPYDTNDPFKLRELLKTKYKFPNDDSFEDSNAKCKKYLL